MPLTSDMPLVSVDDHIIERPAAWTDRLPQAMRDAGPRVVELTEPFEDPMSASTLGAGTEVWLFEGRIYPQSSLNTAAGHRFEEHSLLPFRYNEILPGCFDATARVADLDRAGISSSLGFPTVPRFSGTLFLQATDRELAAACVRAYNDYVLEEWYGAAPDRFIPLMLVPLWDIEAACAETDRVASLGGRAVSLPENPVPLGLPSYHSDYWFPLWAHLEETGLPACMHFGSSGSVPKTSSDAPFAVSNSLLAVNTMTALADLLFAPVLPAYPKLRIVLSEGGIGWIPNYLERAEHAFARHRFYGDMPHNTHPRELFARHIYGCFIDEPLGLKLRDEIGVSNIMWEVDYPHSDTTWPDSRQVAERNLECVTYLEAAAISWMNAQRVFNWTPARPVSAGDGDNS